jgi:acyl carrier protein
MIDDVIRQVLTEHAHLATAVGGLADGTDLYEAGMTSHASVNVMLGLEDAFDIEFPERLLRKTTFASIASIRSALSELTEMAS